MGESTPAAATAGDTFRVRASSSASILRLFSFYFVCAFLFLGYLILFFKLQQLLHPHSTTSTRPRAYVVLFFLYIRKRQEKFRVA